MRSLYQIWVRPTDRPGNTFWLFRQFFPASLAGGVMTCATLPGEGVTYFLQRVDGDVRVDEWWSFGAEPSQLYNLSGLSIDLSGALARLPGHCVRAGIGYASPESRMDADTRMGGRGLAL